MTASKCKVHSSNSLIFILNGHPVQTIFKCEQFFKTTHVQKGPTMYIFYLFYFIMCIKLTRNIMSTVHHTKLQVNGPSGHCSHLDFNPPPEVQQPSPVRKIQPPPFKLSPLNCQCQLTIVNVFWPDISSCVSHETGIRSILCVKLNLCLLGLQ